MPDDSFDLDAALEDEGTPAGLRKWAESVKKQNQKLADELAGLRKAERQGSITGALKTLGVNDRVAQFYPGDADASPDAVAKWLKDNEGVFAALPAQPNDEAGSGQQTALSHADQAVPADLITAMRQVQDATPVTGGATPTIADKAAEIDKLTMRTADDRSKLDAFERDLMEMARAQQAAHETYRR